MARSLRAIKRAGGTFKAMGALMALLSVLAVCVFAGAEMALANTDGATNYVADASTADAYKDIFGMPGTAGSETISTRYSGRVWADKSVSAGDSVTFSGVDENGSATSHSLEKKYNGDFLVTYSAMATSQEITQLPKIPVDVVFVLDFSGSMNWGQSSQETVEGTPAEAQAASRLQAMVDSLNTTIATLVEDNPENRIGIAVFNGTASTLLKLTSASEMTGVSNGEYLEITRFVPNDSGTKREADATVRCNINGESADTAGGTNIQAGMDLGMSMLTGINSAYTYEGTTYTRIPNVVLMSDGAPTSFSSATDASWNPAGSYGRQRGTLVRENNNELFDVDIDSTTRSGSWWSRLASNTIIGRGDTSNPHSADGFMALLTASYKKNQITANYRQQASEKNAPNADNAYCRVYTIGFSTDQQTPAMQEMVDVVLNPESTALGANSNADQVREVSEAWDAYSNNRETIVHGELGNNSGNYAYQVEIPRNDSNNPDSLYYVDRYFAATNSDELNNAFQQITSAITDSAKIPTETTGGTQTPLHDGYITYTDPIGDYMEVKGITGLLFGDTTFVVSDQHNSQENGATVTTYTLNTQADGKGTDSVESALYSNQSVNNIIIQVSRDNTTGKQELTVQIPAALIPLRINYVTVKSDGTTVSNNPEETYTNNVYPLRLVYEVGVAGGVVDGNGSIVEGDGAWNNDSGSFNGVAESYLTSHSDGSNSVYFYSNAYSGASQINGDETVTVGDATMTFTPADDNPFYFIQEDTPLYTGGTEGVLDQGGVLGEPVNADNVQAGTTYYFLIEYYEGASKVQRVIGRDGSTLSGFVGQNAEGQLCILEGSPRLGNLLDVVAANKDPNANQTGTALASYYPTFVDNNDEPTTDHQAGHFKVYLGNNGRLSVSLPGPDVLPALQVTKNDADDALKTLEGAGFALYVDTNGNEQFDEGVDQPMGSAGSGAAEVTTGQGGIARFEPDKYKFVLGTTYFLVETQAPDGHQLMDGAVKIVFSENNGEDQQYPEETHPFMADITFPGAESSETVYSSAATGPEGDADYQVATVELTVSDKAIPSLPATGSNGRTALAATGVAAVTLGAYALWSRRRAFDR